MADLTNPIGWGLDELRDLFQKVMDNASTEYDRLSTNNGKLVALNAQLPQIDDPDQRAATKAWIDQVVSRQVSIAGTWRTLYSKVQWISDQLKKFLGSMGLSGLGQAQVIVPVAIVAVVLLAWAGVVYIHERNNAQDTAVQMLSNGMAAIIAQGATPQQIIDYAKQAESTAKGLEPKDADPFGLSPILKQLGPVLFGVAAIALLPTLIGLFRSVRNSRAAA